MCIIFRNKTIEIIKSSVYKVAISHYSWSKDILGSENELIWYKKYILFDKIIKFFILINNKSY